MGLATPPVKNNFVQKSNNQVETDCRGGQGSPRAVAPTGRQTYNVIRRVTIFAIINIVAYLLKARTVEPEKEPLLGNDRKQQ
jgi:hypothetical protein